MIKEMLIVQFDLFVKLTKERDWDKYYNQKLQELTRVFIFNSLAESASRTSVFSL